MASFLVHATFLLYFAVSLTFSGTINGKFSEQYPMVISTKRMEKMTRLRFYFHDIHSGKNPTVMRIIAGQGNKTTDGFGSSFMMDDPLTEGPEPTSKLIGRARGMYALASQEGIELLMLMNLAFVEGKFNGSALSILGRNTVYDEVREMPVVGGSGLFRFARGYSLEKTLSFNPKTKNAVVEYNVTVIHF